MKTVAIRLFMNFGMDSYDKNSKVFFDNLFFFFNFLICNFTPKVHEKRTFTEKWFVLIFCPFLKKQKEKKRKSFLEIFFVFFLDENQQDDDTSTDSEDSSTSEAMESIKSNCQAHEGAEKMEEAELIANLILGKNEVHSKILYFSIQKRSILIRSSTFCATQRCNCLSL